MQKVLLLGLAAAMISCTSSPKENLLAPGIPLKMAAYRHQQISDVTYNLSFDIPREKTEAIPAMLEATMTIHDISQPLYLDFNAPDSLLKKLWVNDQKLSIDHREEHLVIAPDNLIEGENLIKIEFLAGEQSLNRNDDFLYTLLVPDRASTLFPCFDQPNIKARYNLQITAPEEWQVLAGAPLEKVTTTEGRKTWKFAKSDSMSTYLFSFVVGKFQKETQQPDGREMSLLYRETDSTKIRMSLPAIFDLHQQSIVFLEDYTAYPFPFQKLDFAAIPGFQYGGMEHVGAIQYREAGIFLDSSATEVKLLDRGKVIAHETSHMWFGDMVTMDWFNDVWMKEVFANFMADKIVNPAFPEINHSLNFLISHYPAAYSEDRTQGSNPIRQQLENLKNAGSLYGSIIYHKAPIMMRQLESVVGKEVFRDGIREYMKTFAYSNATWPDLIQILDKRTKNDLQKWSDVWVNQPGRPKLSANVTYENGKIQQLEISQKAEDGSDKLWSQTFEITLVYADSLLHLPVSLDQATVGISEAIGLSQPEAILYNSDGFGYGIFPIDSNAMDLLPNIDKEITRASFYLDLYENVLTGNLSPIAGLQGFKKALAFERNELTLSLVTSKISSLFWHYLTADERAEEQSDLLNLLNTELAKSHSSNSKKTIFNLYEDLAYSPEGQKRLYQIWSKEQSIPGLRLNEDDYTSLAMKLALYDYEKKDEILDKAQAAISNPDKLKRFQFLRPALSSDVSVRDSVITAFQDTKNREKESWVLTACSYLHHPLRQASAEKHLKMSLDLLEEIQKTGDIFFPKGWLNATIGQYQSAVALKTMESYLAEHPDLNSVLKGKLLQATDDLYRFNQQYKRN